MNRKRMFALSLGALGVVFGDIGTSPLYAIEQLVSPPANGLAITPENVLGVSVPGVLVTDHHRLPQISAVGAAC